MVAFPWKEVAAAEAWVEAGLVDLCHPRCLLLRRRRRREEMGLSILTVSGTGSNGCCSWKDG